MLWIAALAAKKGWLILTTIYKYSRLMIQGKPNYKFAEVYYFVKDIAISNNFVIAER